jgi:hypothetical protein
LAYGLLLLVCAVVAYLFGLSLGTRSPRRRVRAASGALRCRALSPS